MSDDAPEDRRRAERVPVNMEFGRVDTQTWISDLSEYGVFIQTERPARPGARVRLKFTILLEDPVVIEADGRVVRHQEDPPGMGIEFLDLSPETILRINDVVAQQRPRDLGAPVEDQQAAEEVAPSPEDSFDSAQTAHRGRIPVEARRLERRRAVDDVDDRATNRYPKVNESAVQGIDSGDIEIYDDEEEAD